MTISKSLSYIGSKVFEKSPWIETLNAEFVIIGDGLLFQYNGTGGVVQIPNGVKYLGAEAIYLDNSVTEVIFPPSFTELGSKLTQSTGVISGNFLRKVTIPSTVTKIEENAFLYCGSLTTIAVSKGSYAETFAKEHGYQVEYI